MLAVAVRDGSNGAYEPNGFGLGLCGERDRRTAGERVGTMWIISDGLKPGERVIVEGLQKVKDGTVAVPKPFVAKADSTSAPAGNTEPR